jgi:hypothetical protein
MKTFLSRESPAASCEILSYNDFFCGAYDAIINCVGIADPNKQVSNPYESFVVTERFDNMAIEYAKANAGTRYVNFTSGAIFGTEFQNPVHEDTIAEFHPNSLVPADCYRISKLNSEAKHRFLPDLPIVDIRIFSFFSRFIDLNAGFMLSEIAKCVLEEKPFKTTASDIVRDYISPEDLFLLLSKILSANPMNVAFDARSVKETRKFEILAALHDKFNLKIETVGEGQSSSLGQKRSYYSMSSLARDVMHFNASCTSLECIEQEMTSLLKSTVSR